MWSPPSPTRLRPAMLLTPSLIEHVGQRLASEFQQIFHLHGQIHDTDSQTCLIPRSRKASTTSGRLVLNLGSPISLHFPTPSPAAVGLPHSAESTPLLTPHLSPSLSSNTSVESLLLEPLDEPTPSSEQEDGIEIIEDPYHVRPRAPIEEDLSSLRAASARAAYLLPPQPRFFDIDPSRRARSSEEIRRKCQLQKQRSPSMDWEAALKEFRRTSDANRSSTVSEEMTTTEGRPLRSVRSIVKLPPAPELSLDSPPSSPTSPTTPITLPASFQILARKSLSSGINLDTAFESNPYADEDDWKQPRLHPRKVSSSSSLSA